MAATHCQCNHNKIGHKSGYGSCFNCKCRTFRSEDELGCHPDVRGHVRTWKDESYYATVERADSATNVWSCQHRHKTNRAGMDCLARYLRQRAKEVASCTQANCLKG